MHKAVRSVIYMFYVIFPEWSDAVVRYVCLSLFCMYILYYISHEFKFKSHNLIQKSLNPASRTCLLHVFVSSIYRWMNLLFTTS